jgi:hypothetical protein
MEFLNHPYLMAFVAVISWPVYKTLAKLFFGERYEDLGETLKYVVQFDFISLFKGQYWNDWDATLKFNFFLFMCVGWVAAITELICRWFLLPA